MKIALSSPQLWRFTPMEVLTIAADLGFGGVELWAYHLLRDEADLSALSDQASDFDLSLSLHMLSWDLNFCSPLPAIRKSSLDLLAQSIEMAAALNANPAVMHPGRKTVPGDGPEAYWDLLVAGLSRLAHHARERGVRLVLEHMEPLAGELLVAPEEVKRLWADVDDPNLTLAFDVAHVPWEHELLDFYREMPPVTHIHLSDASPGTRHLPLGAGQRDLEGFIKQLVGNYQGLVVIEGIEHRRTIALARANKLAWDALVARVNVS